MYATQGFVGKKNGATTKLNASCYSAKEKISGRRVRMGIYLKDGCLRVHFDSVAGLAKVVGYRVCNPYVKIHMLHNGVRFATCKLPVKNKTWNPIYDKNIMVRIMSCFVKYSISGI